MCTQLNPQQCSLLAHTYTVIEKDKKTRLEVTDTIIIFISSCFLNLGTDFNIPFTRLIQTLCSTNISYLLFMGAVIVLWHLTTAPPSSRGTRTCWVHQEEFQTSSGFHHTYSTKRAESSQFFGREAFIIALKKIGFSKVVNHGSHEGSSSLQSWMWLNDKRKRLRLMG